MFKQNIKMRTFAALMAACVMCLVLATQSFAAYSVKQVWARVSGTSGETLATGQVVCIADADGYVYKADANDAALRPAIGIIGKGGASGDTVEIITMGRLTGWSALAEGAAVYLSETAAAATQSSPDWSQQIGVAVSATDYLFNFQNYFDTSAIVSIGTMTGASPIVLEGATADAYETTIAVTDPTADRTVTLADGTGTLMLTSLVTNATDVANAVTGASNALVYEGATADDYETSIVSTDPTADRTVTLPNATGTVLLGSTDAVTATSDGAAASLLTLTSLITTNGDEDLDNVTLADGTAGQIKCFVCVVEGAAGDTVKITPAHLNAGTQITFDGTIGYGCIMIFDGTAWNIIGHVGGTIA